MSAKVLYGWALFAANISGVEATMEIGGRSLTGSKDRSFMKAREVARFWLETSIV